MSSFPHERIQAPHEGAELSVSLDEARLEVEDTIESLIIKAVEKAEKLSVDSLTGIAPLILSQQEIPEDALRALSVRGMDLYRSIVKLRTAKTILSKGIRDDATNEELLELVNELEKWNHWWKTYVDEEIKDSNSLTMVVGNSAYALQKKLVFMGKPMLSPSSQQQLQQLQNDNVQ